MESAASSELLMRLKAYPKMQEILGSLTPKILLLSSNEPTREVSLQSSELKTRVRHVTQRIETAHFIGRADKPIVIKTYEDYVSRIAIALTETLSLLPSSSDVAKGESAQLALPLPVVDAP